MATGTGKTTVMGMIAVWSIVPIAAYATLEDGGMNLRGLVASLDGTRVLRAQVRGRVEDAEPLGAEAAAAVLEQGAGEILARIYAEAGR